MIHGSLVARFDAFSMTGVGAAGLFFGSALLTVMVWRLPAGRRHRTRPVATIFGFTVGLLLMAMGGLMVAIGSIFATYQQFTYEIPVAEITTRPARTATGQPIAQVRYHPLGGGRNRYFFVRGDQWMIEGDILKWKPWLTILGLQPRYRLTRMQGRYLDIETERSAPRSLFSLIDDSPTGSERHPFWRFLYRSGQKLPLVDTVYGNAAYQNLHDDCHYQIFVGTGGLIIRKLEKGETRAVPSRT